MEIAKTTYELTKRFPDPEKFGLIAQMRRAAVSIPSNIAEGYSRKNNKEFKQFLYIALGSLAELETQMLLALDFGYVTEHEDFLRLCQFERAMILKLCHRSS